MERFVLFVGIIAIFTWNLSAQTTLQVVTKKVVKTFNYQNGHEVNIEGQKAEISVNTWDKQEIKVEIEFKSKHPERKIAERDIEKIVYLATKAKNKIYLRNYVDNDQGQPASLLSVIYNITLPKDCPVYLKNHFGIATLSNLTNSLRINSSFTKIDLEELSGSLDVNTKFGDLAGKNLNTKAVIQSRRSNLHLYNIQGEFDIRAELGIVEVFAHPMLASLKIDAEKADVFTYFTEPEKIAYNLQALASNVEIPSEVKLTSDNKENQVQHLLYKPKQEIFSLFQINVRFGELKIAKFKKP